MNKLILFIVFVVILLISLFFIFKQYKTSLNIKTLKTKISNTIIPSKIEHFQSQANNINTMLNKVEQFLSIDSCKIIMVLITLILNYH